MIGLWKINQGDGSTEDVSEKLQKILEMLSEKPASEFSKNLSSEIQKNESKNAGDMFAELFLDERK